MCGRKHRRKTRLRQYDMCRKGAKGAGVSRDVFVVGLRRHVERDVQGTRGATQRKCEVRCRRCCHEPVGNGGAKRKGSQSQADQDPPGQATRLVRRILNSRHAANFSTQSHRGRSRSSGRRDHRFSDNYFPPVIWQSICPQSDYLRLPSDGLGLFSIIRGRRALISDGLSAARARARILLRLLSFSSTPRRRFRSSIARIRAPVASCAADACRAAGRTPR